MIMKKKLTMIIIIMIMIIIITKIMTTIMITIIIRKVKKKHKNTKSLKFSFHYLDLEALLQKLKNIDVPTRESLVCKKFNRKLKKIQKNLKKTYEIFFKKKKENFSCQVRSPHALQ